MTAYSKAAYDRRSEDRKTPEGWAKFGIWTLRCRAKKRNLPFDLDASDIAPPAICPVLGLPLVLGAPASSPNSAHVDRFDNEKGYVKGNVRVISGRANYLKRDATFSELEAVLAYMKG